MNRKDFYVFAPAGVVTGGAELLHQLVSSLNDNGLNAYIVYFNGGNKVPEEYKKYNIKIADHIPDNDHIVEVLYEGIFEFSLQRVKTFKVLWWLSVDNFYICSKNLLSLTDLLKFNPNLAIKEFARRIYRVITTRTNPFENNISLSYLKGLNALSLYQSEYAQNFLIKQGFRKILPLKDYINDGYLSTREPTSRKNIILYNPKKGFKFTQKLINSSGNLNWVPIQGLNREQVKKLMLEAKVYVDFGYHPGKDRLPREAILSGCCIITGKQGSAKYFEDVLTPDEFSFEDDDKHIPLIIRKIEDIFYDFKENQSKFKFYEYITSKQKLEFEEQVKDFIKYYE